MLNKVLAALDLNDDEVRLYIRLLEAGASTAGALAKNLKLVRPTVYNLLQRMRDKGVVTQSMKNGVRLFQVEPPRKLEQAFTQRIRDLESNRDKLMRLMPDLERRMATPFLEPKFQIFEGPEGVRNVLMDTLLYRDIATWSFWPVKAMVELLSPEFFRFHSAERIRNRVFINGIWPRNQIIDLKRYPFMGTGPENFREVRIAPREVDFSMCYWVYASKVAFLSSRRECYGFVVESAELAALMKTQHQVIWKLSKPLPAKPEEIPAFLTGLKT